MASRLPGMASMDLNAFPGEVGALMEQLRSTIDGAVSVLSDANLKSEAASAERRKRLRRMIYPSFDFAEMAKQSLGIHWRRRTAEEQHEFVSLFAAFFEEAYVGAIESYNGEKIIYAHSIHEQEYGEVDTKILTATGEELSVAYKLHLVDGRWKIYDLVIGSTSVVNNYRSQFHRTITTASYEELMRALRETRVESRRETSSEIGES